MPFSLCHKESVHIFAAFSIADNSPKSNQKWENGKIPYKLLSRKRIV